MIFILLWVFRNKHQQLMIFIWSCFLLKVIKKHRADLVHIIIHFAMYLGMGKVLGKVWPGFKNKYDLDIYGLR